MLSWVGVILGILGAIVNVYKHWSCFVMWSVANFILIYHNLETNDYAQTLLFLVYQVITTFGLIKWMRDRKAKLLVGEKYENCN